MLAHQLRAAHDAVLVGVGTVIADDPQLTVRLCPGPDPLRIIVDSRFRTPENAKVLIDGKPTVIATAVTGHNRRMQSNTAVLTVPQRDGHVDLQALVQLMGFRDIGSILVEGGPTIATAFLREHLVDEAVCIIAPTIIGTGTNAVGDLGIETMEKAIVFADASFTPIGRDLVFRGRPVWADGQSSGIEMVPE